MKSKKVLMVGPFPKPITGVSLANQVVREILDGEEDFGVRIINTSYTRFDEAVGTFTLHKFFFNLSFYVKAFQVFRCNILYLTPGQTFFGVTKYLGFYLLGALSRKRIITHVHGNHMGTAYRGFSGVKKWLYKMILKQTSIGIVLSDSLKQNMLPFIAESSIKVLPNFAQDYLYTPSPSKNYNEVRIVYLSNLMEEKGIFELLQSLKYLEENNIQYAAKVAGSIDVQHKEKIKHLLEALKNVQYLGVVKGEEKKALLGWSNTFVLPTYYKMEGQPISILEAMATGNVIVTTRHAGIPDVVKDGTHGFFVEKKSYQSLSECLEKLNSRKDKLQEIGERNENYFRQNYTKSIFRERLLRIVRNDKTPY